MRISVGTSRKETNWRNIELTKGEFLERLSNPTRTSETYEEYKKSTDKDTIKDVGAFVGAHLIKGRRTKAGVRENNLIVLDIDYGNSDTLDEIERGLTGIEHTIHSTHSHSSANPRYRLIVYPTRPLLAEEYEAVARQVANMVNIEAFDKTTYDRNRLFFWPSVSKDGEFYFNHADGEELNVDTVLQGYGDWRDVSLWPKSLSEDAIISKTIGKQENPMEKRNVVGAFCQTIPIRNAIEKYLSGVYREDGDRYTYIDGSTVRGVVIYDDIWAYSHHATDPCSGRLCNAFDLVRIHKFGHLDSKCKKDSKSGPSYDEMKKFVIAIPEVKAAMIKMKLDDVSEEEFKEFDLDSKLDIKEDGTIRPTWANVYRIVKRHPVKIELDLFEGSYKINRKRMMDDYDIMEIVKWLGYKFKLNIPSKIVREVLIYIAKENEYHPVKEYLENLVWDGVKRVDTLFSDYIGCEDTAYTRDVSKITLCAAVKRIYEPGCKFDYVPVLVGKQGEGKGLFMQTLAIEPEWYGEVSSMDYKISMEETSGKWIVELPELSTLKKHDIEVQKAFITAQSKKVRAAYAHLPTEYKRQFIMIGSCNNEEFLADNTGNRRWWPLMVEKKIDTEKLMANRDMLWAEAYQLYKSGIDLWLKDETEAQQAQERVEISNPYEGIILEWLKQKCSEDRYNIDRGRDISYMNQTADRDKICYIEVFQDCLGFQDKPTVYFASMLNKVMKKAKGWTKSKSNLYFGKRFGHQKGWYKSE
jgi:hypothetical protein